MFDFQETLSATYEWPVEFKVPVSGGKSRTIKFTAVFNRLDKTESKKLSKEALEETDETDDKGKNIVVIRYKTVLDGALDHLKAKTDQGKTEELPDDIQEELLAVTGAEAAIYNAYLESVSGEKVKN